MPANEDGVSISRTGPERAAALHVVADNAPPPFQRTHVPRTKIVGTLGPSSNTTESIRDLIEAGLWERE